MSRHGRTLVVRAYPHARASFANRATSFTRFARIARIDSNARVTDTATRSTHARRPGTRASTRVASRVGANAVRTRTFPRQPVRGDGVRHGSPTHQVGGAGRGSRRYVVAASRRARREGENARLKTPRDARTTQSTLRALRVDNRGVFLGKCVHRSSANPRAPLTDCSYARPRPRNTR